MASLTITNPVIESGDFLNFTFSGMVSNENVWVGVLGGGGTQFKADSQGSGSGAFQINEGGGDYVLEARGDSNRYATAAFTITSASNINYWSLVDKYYNFVTSANPAQEEANNWVLVDKALGYSHPSAQEEANNWVLVDKALGYSHPSAQEEVNNWILVDKGEWFTLPSAQEVVSSWALVGKTSILMVKTSGGGGEEKESNWLPMVLLGGAFAGLAIASSQGEKGEKKKVSTQHA
jgi:hypothetical protein